MSDSRMPVVDADQHEERLLGYNTGPYGYRNDIAALIVQIILSAVIVFAGGYAHARNNDPMYNVVLYLVPGLMLIIGCGSVGLMSSILRLEQTVEGAKSEYQGLCKRIASEINSDIVELVKQEIERLEPMHRNDRIRLENALEHMASALVTGSSGRAL